MVAATVRRRVGQLEADVGDAGFRGTFARDLDRGVVMSIPTNCEFGNARAMTMVLAPWPQPTSATRPPVLSFSTTPSRAGSHEDNRFAL
jgi:hypothetical protein